MEQPSTDIIMIYIPNLLPFSAAQYKNNQGPHQPKGRLLVGNDGAGIERRRLPRVLNLHAYDRALDLPPRVCLSTGTAWSSQHNDNLAALSYANVGEDSHASNGQEIASGAGRGGSGG